MPQQALALANSPLSLAQARRLAAQAVEQVGPEPSQADDAAFIAPAFERDARPHAPTPEEQAPAQRFLDDQAGRLADRPGSRRFRPAQAVPVPPAADPAQRARENLVHVLFNHNDFVMIR